MSAYRTAHLRIQAARGRASEQRCADCNSEAQDWSLNTEAFEICPDTGMKYSNNVDDYLPRCKKCHATADGKHNSSTGKAGRDAALEAHKRITPERRREWTQDSLVKARDALAKKREDENFRASHADATRQGIARNRGQRG